MLIKNTKEESNFKPNNTKKNMEKTMNKSKSCKKFMEKDNINKTCQNICTYKNNNSLKTSFCQKRKNKQNQDSVYSNNIGRKTICNFNKNKKINLNNSFNFLNKNDKNKKIFTEINTSKNINNKNENMYKPLYTNRSNLNIFNNTKNGKNYNNLNTSMNNFYPKIIRKDKIKKSKSERKISDISKSTTFDANSDNKKHQTNEIFTFKSKKIFNKNNTNLNNNNKTLKKNQTMGRLIFMKKNKKDEISKSEKLNKTLLITSRCNINVNPLLFNKKNYRNYICKKIIANYSNNTNINKKKAKKKFRNFLNDENNFDSKIEMNKSFCYINTKKKERQ